MATEQWDVHWCQAGIGAAAGDERWADIAQRSPGLRAVFHRHPGAGAAGWSRLHNRRDRGTWPMITRSALQEVLSLCRSDAESDGKIQSDKGPLVETNGPLSYGVIYGCQVGHSHFW